MLVLYYRCTADEFKAERNQSMLTHVLSTVNEVIRLVGSVIDATANVVNAALLMNSGRNKTGSLLKFYVLRLKTVM